MKYLFTFIIACCIICGFNSCKDKRQELLLQESSMRLERQNDYLRNQNQFLRGRFDKLLFDEYSEERFEYFKAYTKRFYLNIDLLCHEIILVKNDGKEFDSDRLYQHYEVCQSSYLQLKNCVADSFCQGLVKERPDSFMALNAKGFIQKYIRSKDSANLRIELLNLQSDLAFFEAAFLENLMINMEPHLSCGAMANMAMAFTKKNLYRKGDKLEVTAILGNYLRSKSGSALIEGQVIKEDQGVYYYSRKITERPGDYVLKFIITKNINGQEGAYPAAVSYRVE